MGVHQPQTRARLRITSTFMLYLFRRAAPDEWGVVFIHSFGRRIAVQPPNKPDAWADGH